jgi:hypothetical protein
VFAHQTLDLKELTLRNSLHRFSNRSLALLRPMGQNLVRLDLGGYKVPAHCSLIFSLGSLANGRSRVRSVSPRTPCRLCSSPSHTSPSLTPPVPTRQHQLELHVV